MKIEHGCAVNHFGPWAVNIGWLNSAIASVKNGSWQAASSFLAEEGKKLYTLTPEGIAVFSLNGHLTRGQSKFGGTSSLSMREGLRECLMVQ